MGLYRVREWVICLNGPIHRPRRFACHAQKVKSVEDEVYGIVPILSLKSFKIIFIGMGPKG